MLAHRLGFSLNDDTVKHKPCGTLNMHHKEGPNRLTSTDKHNVHLPVQALLWEMWLCQLCFSGFECSIRHCHSTVGKKNVQLLREQTDFDFTVRQCLVSRKNNAYYVPIRQCLVSKNNNACYILIRQCLVSKNNAYYIPIRQCLV